MKRSLLVSVVILLLSVILLRRLEAQQPAIASLVVSVMDTSGAVIPDATVEAFAEQKEVAAGQTGPDGKALLRLAQGSYEIRAEATAFRSEKVDIELADSSPVSHVFRLQVSSSCSPCVVVENPAQRLELWTPPLEDVFISTFQMPAQVRLKPIRRVH